MTKEINDIQAQVHDGKTAGELLRAARTTGRRKRELQTIARQLCIREEFLEALEACEYNKIPELVYILGFARNYALELELDPNIVVQKIKYELGVLKIDEEDEEKQDDDAQNTQADCVAQCNKIPTAAVAAGAGGDAGGFFARTWKYFAGGAAVILVLAVFFALRGRAPETAEQLVVAIPVAEQQAPATPAVRATPEFTVPVREAFGLANRADATVILQATAETWLKVEDARGETLFSRVLSEGDVYYVPTATTRATVGNAGGIDVWVNGRLAPRLGGDRVRRSGILLTPAALMPE